MNFETVGLSRTIVADYFPGVVSKISGIGLTGIEKKIRSIHKEAFESSETILPIGGIYRYRKNGETHQYQGKLIHLLQSAVGSNSYEAYKRYAEGIYNLPPINLRDLIDFRSKKLKGRLISLKLNQYKIYLKDLEAEACHMERFQKKLMKHLPQE